MARIGLVLGGGGVVATAWHAGVLTALLEHHGWDARKADLIVGTSGGAITAASLRADIPPGDLADGALGRPLTPGAARILGPLRAAVLPRGPRIASPTSRFRRGNALVSLARRPRQLRAGLVATALVPVGRLSSADITNLLDLLFPAGWPQAPLWLPAVRLPDLSRVVFGRDGQPATTVGRAAAASCAVPGLFAPVEVRGVDYVDGGAHSPTNLDVVVGAGLDLVILSAPMSRWREAPEGRRLRAAAPEVGHYVAREARLVRQSGTRVLVFAPTRAAGTILGHDLLAPTRMRTVAEAAYAAARRRLDEPEVRQDLALTRLR
ncbi:NTE family protein [Geodermatophilus bullaregiensis]|uniref:patatin-like phospholipase family protein n=1 Tax=Geodermatophilus bullaregiensis TaxID=1564160 RepID=UPI00195F1FD0|nr:patatin-like phospholipase family protein [Geodermatophilus bullaregiensis]MBM7808034.1 NTE family protein [Geodermatophilus bullaregiensis]